MRLQLLERLMHPRQPLALQRLRLLEPVARRVPGADLLPDEYTGGIEPLEQRRVERMLRTRRVRPDRLESTDEPVHVGGSQSIAMPARVLVKRCAVQEQRLAVEIRMVSLHRQLA